MNKVRFWISTIYLIQLILAVVNPFGYHAITLKTSIIYLSYIFAIFISGLSINRNSSIHKSFELKTIFKYFPKVYLFIAIILYATLSYKRIQLGLSLQEFRDFFFFATNSIFSVINLPFIFLNSFALYGILIRLNLGKLYYREILELSAGFILVNVSAGGRTAIFALALLFLVVFLRSRIIRKAILKDKLFKRLSIVAIFVIVITTFNRSFAALGIEGQFRYLVGPIFLLNAALEDPIGLLNLSEMRMGFSLSGLDWFVCALLNGMGFLNEKIVSINSIVNYTLTYGYEIGTGRSMNAFYTIVFSFYQDFSISGPLVLMVYAYVVRLFINRKLTWAYGTYIDFILLYGFINNLLTSPTYSLVLLLFIFVNPFKYSSS